MDQVIKQRPLTDFEDSILGRMLSYEFEGRETIKEQLRDVHVEITLPKDEYGSIRLVTKSTQPANVSRVPIELESLDEDQVPIAALLHVVNGFVDELEFYKADGTRIIKMPNPDMFSRKTWQEER